ncbi:MAG TPA: helix-turn-helix domain-containing protein [Acidimicrobiia bacterium]|nr:helix-turn-helix domain-containing protein [Acidimicrobiia bacterium]
MKSLSNDERWDAGFPESAEFAMIPKQVFSQCSVNAICVYAALAMYRNYSTSICWPSQGRLAMHIRRSKSTVKRALIELCELGIIEKTGRYNMQFGKKTCIYRLCTPWSSGGPPVEINAEPTPNSSDELSHGSPATYKREENNKKNLNDTLGENDELFIAVCEATQIDRHSIPRTQKQKLSSAVAGLREVHATPFEIHRRAKAMRCQWTSGKVTPVSLLSHWAEFAVVEPNEERRYGYIEKEENYVWDESLLAAVPREKK